MVRGHLASKNDGGCVGVFRAFGPGFPIIHPRFKVRDTVEGSLPERVVHSAAPFEHMGAGLVVRDGGDIAGYVDGFVELVE